MKSVGRYFFYPLACLSFCLIFLLSHTTSSVSSNLNPSWRLLYDFNLHFPDDPHYEIATAPDNPAVIYAGGRQTISKSTDYGRTFKGVYGAVLWPKILVIDQNRVVISTYNGVYYSPDGGINWPRISSRQTGFLDFDPQSNVVYFGQRTGNCQWDQRFCGVWRFNLDTLEKEHLFYTDTQNILLTPQTIVAYSGDKISISGDQGASWDEYYLRDRGLDNNHLEKMVFDADSGAIYALATNQDNPSRLVSKFLKSTDYGYHWSLVASNLPEEVVGIRFYLHRGKFYLTSILKGVYRSDDGCRTWQELNRGFPQDDPPGIYSLGFGSSNFYREVIYTGSYQGKVYQLGIYPRYDPVIFIHGLGGHYTDWISGDKKVHFKTLRAAGYPEHYLNSYIYADADGNPDTYDNQGDVALISANLDEEVDRLSQLSLDEGGSGKVDLVGFSLGGIIARYYLNTFGEDKVDQLITIASPHRGVTIFTPEDWFESIPILGVYLRRAATEFVTKLVQLGGLNVDLESAAAQQVRPSSSFLAQLNDNIISQVSVDSLAGDIDMEIRQGFFFWELRRKFSIGDIYMSLESATSPPAAQLAKHTFSDPDVLKFEVSLCKEGVSYSYNLDMLTPGELRFKHGTLPMQPEVVDEVTQLLTN
ncbi:hypothetical protein B5M47_02635 [candidate division CPR3 bacterium 4484_211]|uniref:DUF676 domain-containing protein n=1 Tax=candidate division CPR3 bacterium 4484_211 TaxID=1968527 RepID=A0A1W9NXU6_UNCC3|nr:MAG: hypothetical protein B5M47_02635 [candidate division CPR3 bacterium 4484_211]